MFGRHGDQGMTTRMILGERLRRFRKNNSWTLTELSERSGVPLSSLSKIENSQLSPTYDQLTKLALAFDLDIALLVAGQAEPPLVQPASTGRRSLGSLDDSMVIEDEYRRLYLLNTDLLNKAFTPMIAEVKTTALEDYDELLRHRGEEFIFVINGTLELHTEFYAPVLLEAGQSAYFDSSMGHAYVSKGNGPCRVLSICSQGQPTLDKGSIQIRED